MYSFLAKRIQICIILLAVLILTSPALFGANRAINDGKVDLETLKGEWSVRSFIGFDEGSNEVENLLGDQNIVKTQLVVKGNDRIELQIQDLTVFDWKINYDFTENPVVFEFFFLGSPRNEEAIVGKGLLKIENGILILHMGLNGTPKGFVRQKGLRSMLLRCKKQK